MDKIWAWLGRFSDGLSVGQLLWPILGLGALLSTLFSWLTSTWSLVADQGLAAIIILGTLLAVFVMLGASSMLFAWRYFRPLSTPMPSANDTKAESRGDGAATMRKPSTTAPLNASSDEPQIRLSAIEKEQPQNDWGDECRRFPFDVVEAARRTPSDDIAPKRAAMLLQIEFLRDEVFPLLADVAKALAVDNTGEFTTPGYWVKRAVDLRAVVTRLEVVRKKMEDLGQRYRHFGELYSLYSFRGAAWLGSGLRNMIVSAEKFGPAPNVDTRHFIYPARNEAERGLACTQIWMREAHDILVSFRDQLAKQQTNQNL